MVYFINFRIFATNNQNNRIMTEEIRIKTRDWERLLSPVQQEKYKLAIKQGWFANYHDNAWRHNTFYGAYIWKYPKFIKVVRMFEELLGHKPLWEDITDKRLGTTVKPCSAGEVQARYQAGLVRQLSRQRMETQHLLRSLYLEISEVHQGRENVRGAVGPQAIVGRHH